MNLGSFFYH